MLTILQGDCRNVLKTLPDESVHCCVTSPPYFGLRDYGTAKWEGGEPACQHSVGGQVQDSKAPGAIVSGQRPGVDASRCRKCGARRVDSQIGLEQTPDEYVAQLVAVFREVRRVLRNDGVLFLNLGDSYAGSWRNQGRKLERGSQRPINGGMLTPVHDGRYPSSESNTGQVPPGLKPKDLIGIPWMVAFALRADGWYLRSDIIWSKPNPMPESVTDRPTKAHEYLFLLAKLQSYYYDAQAVAEPAGGWNGSRFDDPRDLAIRPTTGRNRWQERKDAGEGPRRGFSSNAPPGCSRVGIGETRNKRSVWSVATQPYAEAHFATFPEALVEPCVLAGCPSGGTVLDPFAGSGTVGRVALNHGRRAVLIELNPDYCKLIDRRCETTYGLQFTEAAGD